MTPALVFDAEAHTYTLDGVRVPSVTTVLARLYNFEFVNRGVLEAKAHLGKVVHACCDLDDAGELDDASVAPAAAPYLEAYRRFRAHKRTTVLATELVVYSPHGYAGKLDLLTDFDGDRWLIDWKTPLVINPAVALQTAGYLGALPDHLRLGLKKIRRGALQLRDDGTYKLHEFRDANDFPTFISFLNTYRWIQRNHP